MTQANCLSFTSRLLFDMSLSYYSNEMDEEQIEMMTRTCPNCRRTLSSATVLAHHIENYCRYRHGKNARQSAVARQSVSVNGLARDYEMMSSYVVYDVERWLFAEETLVKRVFDKIDDFLVKGRLVLKAWFVKRNPATFEVLRREMIYVSSLPADIVHDFQHWYNRHTAGIIKNLESFQRRDSNLEFDGVEALVIKVNLLHNLSGRSFFKLPDILNRKKAVINVDAPNSCFKYALLSILHYSNIKDNRNRISKYSPWLDELDFGDVDASEVHIKRDVPKIEKLNKLKINIHVWEKGLQGCVYNDHKVLADKTINLLLVVGSDSKENLEEHFQWCARGRLQIEQPPKQTKFSYNALHKELSPVKVLYADIEAFIHEDTHYPAAISSYEVWHPHLTSIKQNRTKLNSWSGEDCIVDFLRYLDDSAQVQHRYDNKMTRLGMNLTIQQQRDFDSCTHCPRCNIKFNETIYKKVRDHDHITGKFRSALCHKCNSKLHVSRRTLPVIFHNFKNYDAHQLIKHGLSKFKHWQLDIIPETKEKYMTLRARIPVELTREGKQVYFNVVFLDSYQFMSSSLASLVNNLDSLPFTEVLQPDYPNLTNETIKRKGVFPYSYFNSLSKLQESCLPPRSAFRNDLLAAKSARRRTIGLLRHHGKSLIVNVSGTISWPT